jgi:hypothetical protein
MKNELSGKKAGGYCSENIQIINIVYTIVMMSYIYKQFKH